MKLSNHTGREIINFLEKLGYKFNRQKGNHRIFTHPIFPPITIPVYKKKTIKPGLLKGILNTIGISRNEFFELLKKS